MWCFCHFVGVLRATTACLNFRKMLLPNVLRATAPCTFWTFGRPKVAQTCAGFPVLTWKGASHQTVCTFSTSQLQSIPNLLVFDIFYLEMCFAPKRRALYQHLNFRKWSEHVVLLTFRLGHVLRATTACNFSSLMWPAGWLRAR